MSSSAIYYGIPLLIGSVGSYFVGMMFDEINAPKEEPTSGLFGETTQVAEEPSSSIFGETAPTTQKSNLFDTTKSPIFGDIKTEPTSIVGTSPTPQISPYLPTAAQAQPYAPITQMPTLEQTASTSPQTTFNISPQIQLPGSTYEQRTPTAPAYPKLEESNSVPSAPTSIPQLPAVPTSIPQLPASPTSMPELPVVPTSIPQLPAVPASVPEVSAVPASVPEVPAVPASVPEVSAVPASVPEVSTSSETFGPVDRSGCVSSVGSVSQGPMQTDRSNISRSISTPRPVDSSSPASVPPPIIPSPASVPPPIIPPPASVMRSEEKSFGPVDRPGCVSSVIKTETAEIEDADEFVPTVLQPAVTTPKIQVEDEVFKGHILDREVAAIPRVPDDVQPVVGLGRRRRFKTARRSYY